MTLMRDMNTEINIGTDRMFYLILKLYNMCLSDLRKVCSVRSSKENILEMKGNMVCKNFGNTGFSDYCEIQSSITKKTFNS